MQPETTATTIFAATLVVFWYNQRVFLLHPSSLFAGTSRLSAMNANAAEAATRVDNCYNRGIHLLPAAFLFSSTILVSSFHPGRKCFNHLWKSFIRLEEKLQSGMRKNLPPREKASMVEKSFNRLIKSFNPRRKKLTPPRGKT